MKKLEMSLWRIPGGDGTLCEVRLPDEQAVVCNALPVPHSRAVVEIPETADEIVSEWMHAHDGESS